MANGKGVAVVAAVMLAAAAHGSHHHGHGVLASLMSSASTVLDGGSHNLGTRRGWARAFLAAIPEPVTHCNVHAVVAWEHAEGGGFGNQAENNPLNVNPGPGAGWPGYSATGAWAFPDPQTGLDYTVQTVRLGYYDGIRAALAAGNDPQGVCDAIMASPWAGSHYNGALTAAC
jgi:CubicO group peptidase (beta-lactamase class C family)